MHALDWLNEHGRILRGAFQPIECVLFALWLLSFPLSLQSELAFRAEHSNNLYTYYNLIYSSSHQILIHQIRSKRMYGNQGETFIQCEISTIEESLYNIKLAWVRWWMEIRNAQTDRNNFLRYIDYTKQLDLSSFVQDGNALRIIMKPKAS